MTSAKLPLLLEAEQLESYLSENQENRDKLLILDTKIGRAHV